MDVKGWTLRKLVGVLCNVVFKELLSLRSLMDTPGEGCSRGWLRALLLLALCCQQCWGRQQHHPTR